MPPWFADRSVGHFTNDPSLSEQQIATLIAWAAAGAPAGDAKDAPAPRAWARGWNIPQPDMVVTMPKAVALPADGDVDYTYEIVPSGFAKDTWVRNERGAALEPRECASRGGVCAAAGIEVAARRAGGSSLHCDGMTDEADRRDAHWTDADILLVYAPGRSPDEWPADFAKLVPAGSDFIFQMHYTTHGKATRDRTSWDGVREDAAG